MSHTCSDNKMRLTNLSLKSVPDKSVPIKLSYKPSRTAPSEFANQMTDGLQNSEVVKEKSTLAEVGGIEILQETKTDERGSGEGPAMEKKKYWEEEQIKGLRLLEFVLVIHLLGIYFFETLPFVKFLVHPLILLLLGLHCSYLRPRYHYIANEDANPPFLISPKELYRYLVDGGKILQEQRVRAVKKRIEISDCNSPQPTPTETTPASQNILIDILDLCEGTWNILSRFETGLLFYMLFTVLVLLDFAKYMDTDFYSLRADWDSPMKLFYLWMWCSTLPELDSYFELRAEKRRLLSSSSTTTDDAVKPRTGVDVFWHHPIVWTIVNFTYWRNVLPLNGYVGILGVWLLCISLVPGGE